MSNSISFIGRLSKDSELKQVGQTTVLECSVASDVGFGDKKVTNWLKCQIWGKRGESVQKILVKGQQVFMTGELTLRKFTTKDGKEGISPEVKVDQVSFVGGKSEGGAKEDSADLPF